MSPQPLLHLVPSTIEVSEETIRKCNAMLDVADAHLDAIETRKGGADGRDRRAATTHR